MQPNIETVQLQPLAISIAEAAKASGIGRTRLYAFIKEGRLRARKNGEHTIILVADLQAFLESLPTMEAA